MSIDFAPLHDRIVVRRIHQQETTSGGLVIPDTAKEKPQEGEVLAVGKGKKEPGNVIPLDLKVGDRVLFARYAGNEIVLHGEEYLIMREEEVLGVLTAPGNQTRAAA